jgi:hypothetical protein
MSACAMFSLKSPSRLAFDQPRVEGHWGTIDGMGHVPGDTPMRERLDPLSPESLRPWFTSVFRQLQRGKALEPMTDLDGHDWWSREGTGYFASQTIHGASCLHKTHRHGSVTYAQQMLGAAIVHPDGRAVLPLLPEPIVHQEGTDNNDGERTAAKRFMATWRQEHPHLKCIVTEDRLSANAPPIEVLHDHDLHDILGVKEGDRALLCEPVQAAAPAGGVTDDARQDRAAGVVHRVRLVNDVPLKESNPDVQVHCIEDWERGQAKVQHCSGVTDIRVSQRHVYRLMRGGRARWKIDNEPFNTLKNQGDHFEHHDGHGEPHLSVVFALVMMLAFLVDQTRMAFS